MPNPDALLLKKFFFDGWFVREWFIDIDSTELHTVPQISVTDYKSYFTIYMKEKLKDNCYNDGTVEGRSRMYDFIHENIDKWQLVYNALCDREGNYDLKKSALNKILKKILYIPGYFLGPGRQDHPWYPDSYPDPWHPQPQ